MTRTRPDFRLSLAALVLAMHPPTVLSHMTLHYPPMRGQFNEDTMFNPPCGGQDSPTPLEERTVVSVTGSEFQARAFHGGFELTVNVGATDAELDTTGNATITGTTTLFNMLLNNTLDIVIPYTRLDIPGFETGRGYTFQWIMHMKSGKAYFCADAVLVSDPTLANEVPEFIRGPGQDGIDVNGDGVLEVLATAGESEDGMGHGHGHGDDAEGNEGEGKDEKLGSAAGTGYGVATVVMGLVLGVVPLLV